MPLADSCDNAVPAFRCLLSLCFHFMLLLELVPLFLLQDPGAFVGTVPHPLSAELLLPAGFSKISFPETRAGSEGSQSSMT